MYNLVAFVQNITIGLILSKTDISTPLFLGLICVNGICTILYAELYKREK